jgi:hypothetical protein
MHLPSQANIGVTQRCHYIIPMCQSAAEEIANWMVAMTHCCIVAKAGSQAGLQTCDIFASTWFKTHDMFASRSTRVVRLANI